ncbi:MAG: Wzz/FepE/Etk N-terminal domain-containing protein, partial [Phycisphaerales bacterium]|nr:Wzz/FepE/Etk N-terminal domain-containing protein [Phycisphaerales bacterium]
MSDVDAVRPSGVAYRDGERGRVVNAGTNRAGEGELVSKGETFLIRRSAGEKPAELIRVPDELIVLAHAERQQRAEDIAVAANSRDLLFILFRHARKSLGFFAVVFGLALAAALLLPASYRSTASLLVRLGPESMLPDPSVQIGKAVVSPIQSRVAEINTELQILRSREVAEAVIARLGSGRILSGAAPAPVARFIREDPDNQAAILKIDRKLLVEVEPDSNILRVSFEARDPQVARDVVNAYVDAFRVVRARIHRNPITARFFGNQQEQVRRQIEELEREIRNLKNSTGVADLEEQRKVLISRLGRIVNEMDQVRSQLGATNAMPKHPGVQRLRVLELQKAEAEEELRKLNDVS